MLGVEIDFAFSNEVVLAIGGSNDFVRVGEVGCWVEVARMLDERARGSGAPAAHHLRSAGGKAPAGQHRVRVIMVCEERRTPP